MEPEIPVYHVTTFIRLPSPISDSVYKWVLKNKKKANGTTRPRLSDHIANFPLGEHHLSHIPPSPNFAIHTTRQWPDQVRWHRSHAIRRNADPWSIMIRTFPFPGWRDKALNPCDVLSEQPQFSIRNSVLISNVKSLVSNHWTPCWFECLQDEVGVTEKFHGISGHPSNKGPCAPW